MSDPTNAQPLNRLLADFATLVDNDTLIGNAEAFLAEASDLVQSINMTGFTPTPTDPFKGRTPEPEADPDLFYTMFWRMFDRTPASMVQSFAIPLRRILAQKIFRHCGEGVIFHHNVLFSKGSNISIGEWSLINRYVMLDDRADINIGSFVMVAAGVIIETHTHPFDDFSVPIAYGGRSGLPVSVGSNSVVGYNTVLMAGVNIGYRCIVGANSVVTKDIPDYTVAGGVPATPIKQYLPPDTGDIWTPADGRPEGV
jgi:acetyltransferase-like isoleucine patch superfamily enzyme